MRVFVFLLILASACVAAADPVPDSPSTTRDSTAQARATGTPVSGIEPARSQKPEADTDADEDQWTARNGVNYDTGEICVTRTAGGLCLDGDDD